MNNPIQALAQMAMNRISSDPNFQRNPQAKAFMDIMQRGLRRRFSLASLLPFPQS